MADAIENPPEDNSPTIAVVGSVNLDLVATVPRLPGAGETVSGATLERYPGGKGANQALAARRLGARVALIASVGEDAAADEALSLLKQDGVDLAGVMRDPDQPTGRAMIAVAPQGENQIVVAPGANASLTPERLRLPAADAVICQLETPLDTVSRAAEQARGFLALNLSPATAVPAELLERIDLVVMNETEAEIVGPAINACKGWVVITYGAEGAQLMKSGGLEIAAGPPQVAAVDTTGAGDTFTAALTLRMIEGADPYAALEFACAAGALAATKPGAQPSFPWRNEVNAFMAAVN